MLKPPPKMIVLIFICISIVSCAPQSNIYFPTDNDGGNQATWLIDTRRKPEPPFQPFQPISSTQNYFGLRRNDKEKVPKPIVETFHVKSDIQLRYAHTQVETYVKNPANKAQEVVFTIVLPSSAFISNFSMTFLNNEIYLATVEEKAEAQRRYESALANGASSGIVQQNSRNSNQVSVSVNVEANGKVNFSITYEELLQRQLDKYSHIVHVNLDQIVEDFKIEVNINESLPISSVKVPQFRTNPNAIYNSDKQNPDAIIEKLGASIYKVTYIPSKQKQEEYLKKLWHGKDRLSGDLIVEYDVDRTRNDGNEIHVLDGYFVHFFAPQNLATLPKHIVFVLDTSGSMEGEKIQQTKDAMVTILDDLNANDKFNILTFSDEVVEWTPEYEERSSTGYSGTPSLKDEALKYVLKLEAVGGTNIDEAMTEGVKMAKSAKLTSNYKQLIIFLTDGKATVGETDSDEILKNIKETNTEPKIPIYGLAFGSEADFELVKSIGLTSGAYAKRIFEASDAAIQLEDFYNELSTPLLNNVKFKYVGENVKPDSITVSEFNTYFKGGEYIVAGKLKNSDDHSLKIEIKGDAYEKGIVDIVCYGINDETCKVKFQTTLPPPRSEAQNFIERMWAYLTIKNLLDENVLESKDQKILDITSDEKQPKLSRRDRAIQLARQYNFVTEVTSLVVTKPDNSDKKFNVEISSLDNQNNRYADISPNFSIDNEETEDRLEFNEPQVNAKPNQPGVKVDLSLGEGTTCWIALFAKTYLRGEPNFFYETQKTLGDFNNKTTSMEVRGPCCWILYDNVNLQGSKQRFEAGQYKNSADLGEFFRKVSSLKKLNDC